MVTYLKSTVPGFYYPISEPLDPGSFDIGTTLDDFYAGMYVPLTAGQVQFHADHPEASISEVWRTELDPGPSQEELDAQALNRARQDKLMAIEAYDTSEAVNSFTLSGVRMWFPLATRLGLNNRIEKEELAGRETTVLWNGTMRYVLPIETAKHMLAEVEFYAMECYNVTASHRAAVSAMDSVEDIESYDHTAGYPERLVFALEEGGSDA